MPLRQTSGVVLIPAVGAATTGVVWVLLTWAGLAWDAGVIWWVTLAVGAATVYAFALLVGRARERRDHARLSELSGGRLS
ncbi:hypothetical protein L3i23_22290 [Herbiconiux sp. L3-i23]|nr:hypothetical protein L3i23_22290 [Herbiconiux sp. L3-i23]